MAKTDFNSVDEYIATHPPKVRAVLRKVRSTIRKALPGASEVISYQLPTYKLPEGGVIAFAGWKEHYSLYGFSAHFAEEFGKRLAGYELSKGTIRFPLSEPVPVKLIEDIAKFRARKAREHARVKAAARKK